MGKLLKGINGRLLFVDLSQQKMWDEEIDEETYREYMGGYGVGVKILYERMKPGVDPLGEENILAFMTGALNATGAICCGRSGVMAKSPLTGGWGDANTGGFFGNELKTAGYDGIFFLGKSDKPTYLFLNNGKAVLKDATKLWGKDSFETEDLIRDELKSNKIKVACIGQAGETLSLISGIMNDKGRASARSGLGAVMGSKKLKAVAVLGKQKMEVADKALLKTANEKVRKTFALELPGYFKYIEMVMKPLVPFFVKFKIPLPPPAPAAMVHLFKTFGTSGLTSHSSLTQDAGIKNWKGVSSDEFPQKMAVKISDKSVIAYNTKRFACGSCSLGCGAVQAVDHAEYGIKKGHRPEYESLAAFGTMTLVDHTEAVNYANHLCNIYGFDTISAGGTVSFAMECFEEGIITKEDTGGIDLSWGNYQGMIDILEKMVKREGIGDILADGVKVAAKKIGKGSEKYAMHVGGQEIPQHDPRAAPGFGTTYVVDPTPGRHTQGGTGFFDLGLLGTAMFPNQQLPEKVEKYDFENKAKLQALYSHYTHTTNAIGLCIFPPFMDPGFPIVELINGVTGFGLDFDGMLKIGERINAIRQCFNVREGLKPSDFKLPHRLKGSPPLKRGVLKGITIDIDTLKKRYFEYVDWDLETGLPSKDKIVDLGLEKLLGDLYKK